MLYFLKNFIAIHISNVCAINRNNDLYDHSKNPSKHDGKLKNICPDNSFESSLKKKQVNVSIDLASIEQGSMVLNKRLVHQQKNSAHLYMFPQCRTSHTRIVLNNVFFSAGTTVLQQFNGFNYCIETEYKSRSRFFEVDIFFFCGCSGRSTDLQTLTPPSHFLPSINSMHYIYGFKVW